MINQGSVSTTNFSQNLIGTSATNRIDSLKLMAQTTTDSTARLTTFCSPLNRIERGGVARQHPTNHLNKMKKWLKTRETKDSDEAASAAAAILSTKTSLRISALNTQ